MEDADADMDANAGDARDFEDADADRLGEDANAEANALISSRVRVLDFWFH